MTRKSSDSRGVGTARPYRGHGVSPDPGHFPGMVPAFGIDPFGGGFPLYQSTVGQALLPLRSAGTRMNHGTVWSFAGRHGGRPGSLRFVWGRGEEPAR